MVENRTSHEGQQSPAGCDAPKSTQPDDQLNLLDLIVLLAKRKRLILGLIFLAAVLSTAISFVLPNVYTASAVLMPPQQQQSSASAMLGQLGAIVGFSPAAIGAKNPNDLYVGMLRSRTVSDALIERFKLRQLYDKGTAVETRQQLAERTSISSGKDGLIVIEVDDHDPARAAEMANAYVQELEKLTSVLAVTEAAQRRLFFERQVQLAKDDLAAAEVALKETQEKTGLVQLDQQGRAMIEAVAALRAQIVTRQVELSAMRTFATETNPEYRKTQQELASLRAELRKLERQGGADADLMVGTRDIPAAGLQYLRAYRDVKYAETVFEVMSKQYELARVEEARDAGPIQIVDRAMPPDQKSRPRRGLIIALSTFVTAILSVLGVALVGTWVQLGTVEDRLKLEEVKKLVGMQR
jgi:tyrosine-protein kinase Etk/Wzc